MICAKSMFKQVTVVEGIGADLVSKLAESAGLSDRVAKLYRTYWSVIDQHEGLYLLHYFPDKLRDILKDERLTEEDKQRLFSLRGWVVDGERTVCTSFGYSPNLAADKVEGKMDLVDPFGLHHIIDTKDAKFQIYLEGPLLRKFKYQGVVYTITHKKLRPVNSRYGHSGKFLDLYTALGGVPDEELFDPAVPDSNYTHIFMVVHPDLFGVTKLDPSKKHIAYLTSMQNGPVKEEEVVWMQNWVNKYVTGEKEVKGVVPVPNPGPEGGVIQPSLFGTDIANKFLERGYAPDDLKLDDVDYRVRPGEAVICIYGNRLHKIASTPYYWRIAVAGNEPNRYLTFNKLLDKAAAPPTVATPVAFTGNEEAVYTYEQLFPVTAKPTDKELNTLAVQASMKPFFRLPPLTKPAALVTKDDRVRNMAVLLAMALPLADQADAFGYPLLQNENRNEVATVLADDRTEISSALSDVKNIAFFKDGKIKKSGTAIKRILDTALYRAGVAYENEKKKTKRGENRERYDEILKSEIMKLVGSESGASFYSIYTAVSKFKKMQAQ